jgi:ceramide glucosyltransferase
LSVLVALLTLLVAGSLVYSLLSILAAMRYLAQHPGERGEAAWRRTAHDPEPVSILKPLAGLDEGLEQNLRTFFEQDYPQFELIFAVNQESDPAAAVVRKLGAEYAHIPTRLIITGEPPYLHAKVYSLSRMLAEARYDLVAMSDSDIRVTKSFLHTVAQEFADGETALATCPYRAVAGRSFWSRLEATGMNTTFWQGVLTARMIEGMKFAVGPTIVARRKAIDAIGGIERVKDYIAEDFDLGRLTAEAGFRVILSSYVIEHRIGSEGLAKNFDHRIRWARTSRRSRPSGYVGQIFTYPLPLALVLCAAAPHIWPLLATTAAIRYAAAWTVSQVVLGARLNWVVLPLEDVLGFAFWIAGFFGNTVTWRGRTYRIDREGKAVA